MPGTVVRLALCRRGSNGLSNSQQPFEPSHPDACRRCAVLFSARCQPPVGVWDRQCTACREAKPANQFTADARTKDGLSTRCLSCQDLSREVSRAAADIVFQASARAEWDARLARAARARADILALYQNHEVLPAFSCPVDAGHGRMAPVAEGRRVRLSCGHCGWSEEADHKVSDFAAAALALPPEALGLLRGAAALR